MTFVVNTQKNPSKVNTNTSAINIGSKRKATVLIAGMYCDILVSAEIV